MNPYVLQFHYFHKLRLNAHILCRSIEQFIGSSHRALNLIYRQVRIWRFQRAISQKIFNRISY